MQTGQYPKYSDLPKAPGALYPNAWGVFGEGDQLGTLNRITPERVLAGIATVTEGRVFNLNLPLDAFDPPLISHRGLPKHQIFGLNAFHRDDRIDNFFPQASTQIDSLRHFAHPDQGFYNGHMVDEGESSERALGIQTVAGRGIVGRAVLIDMARYYQHLQSPLKYSEATQITVPDLDSALQWQGTDLQPGDILLIRTGWLGHARQSNAAAQGIRSVGLAQSEETAAWIWDRGLSLVAADNIALEAWPVNSPVLTTNAELSGALEVSSHTGMLHRILIPLLGLSIGELWDLDELANACWELGRFSFLVTAEPLNMPGGVGSPANALAVL